MIKEWRVASALQLVMVAVFVGVIVIGFGVRVGRSVAVGNAAIVSVAHCVSLTLFSAFCPTQLARSKHSALTGIAAADTPDGVYLGLAGGANWVEDDFFFGKFDMQTGYYVGGTVGYKFDFNLRTEFELGYRSNDYDFFRRSEEVV